MANKLRASGQIQDKDRYISISETKRQMVAMLTELQLEIEEADSRAGYAGYGMPTFSTDYIRKKKVNELIRRKIKELKMESEE